MDLSVQGFITLYWYQYAIACNIIISLIMSPLLGHRPSLWITHKKNGPLPTTPTQCGLVGTMTANADGTNGLTCLLKHVLHCYQIVIVCIEFSFSHASQIRWLAG
jgi:hypothetical protein